MRTSIAIAFVLILVIFSSNLSFSQCSIVSSDGYTVHISVEPTAIVVTNNGCPSGFNYNVQLNYSITFSGSNIPGSLYTLQGYVACNSQSQYFDLPEGAGSGTATSNGNQWNGNCNAPFPPTTSSLNCSSLQIQIGGPGINDQTINCPLGSLPIELKGFNVKEKGNTIFLTWTTATEKDNDYFLVEKSQDGKNFIVIDRIEGAGNSVTELNYSSIDYTPFTGVSYYRLKQVDFDRNFSYSEIRRVNISSSLSQILVYPNPNKTDELNLVGSDLYNFVKVDVVSVTGINVYSAALSSTKITLPDIPKGIYYLRLTDALTRRVETLKYVQE